jgi:hypothetical protein
LNAIVSIFVFGLMAAELRDSFLEVIYLLGDPVSEGVSVICTS